MLISTKPTNLIFTVPVTSHKQRQIQPVLECRNLVAQHSGQIGASDAFATADCDTEHEVNTLSQCDFMLKHFSMSLKTYT